MKDPIGVGKYSVTVAPPSPGNRKKMLQRLDVMTRELAHTQMAVSQLRHALQHSGSTKPLADGIMNSRNWVLSLVISHSFIQTMLDNENPYFSMAAIQTRMMAGNAAQEGMDQARKEHIKDIHHQP